MRKALALGTTGIIACIILIQPALSEAAFGAGMAPMPASPREVLPGLWPLALIAVIGPWVALNLIYRGKAPECYGEGLGYKRPW